MLHTQAVDAILAEGPLQYAARTIRNPRLARTDS
jgi:hypothetical protein